MTASGSNRTGAWVVDFWSGGGVGLWLKAQKPVVPISTAATAAPRTGVFTVCTEVTFVLAGEGLGHETLPVLCLFPVLLNQN